MMTLPLYLIATYRDPTHFLQNTMNNQSCSGIYTELFDGTPSELMTMNRHRLLGRPVEIRVVIESMRFEIMLKGTISFVTPVSKRIHYRKLGITFLPYEHNEAKYLFDSVHRHEQESQNDIILKHKLRKSRRFPVKTELQVSSLKPQTKPGFSIMDVKTENLSRDGLCFRSSQKLQPGTRLNVNLLTPPLPLQQKKFSRQIHSQTVLLEAQVQWCLEDHAGDQMIGLSFLYDREKSFHFKAQLAQWVGVQQNLHDHSAITR